MRVICIGTALAIALSACGQGQNSNEGKPAPFVAQTGEFHFSVPKRPDFFLARKFPGFVTVMICGGANASQHCKDFPLQLIGAKGVLTLIMPPAHRGRFEFLKERPLNAPRPDPAPLIDIKTTDAPGANKLHELSRIRSPFADDKLGTTTNGWPVASCGTAPQGHRFCKIGFLLNGAVIEAHVHGARGVELDQAQVWDIASALDAKLRTIEVRE